MENPTTLISDSQWQSDRENNNTLIFPKYKQYNKFWFYSIE